MMTRIASHNQLSETLGELRLQARYARTRRQREAFKAACGEIREEMRERARQIRQRQRQAAAEGP